MIDKLFLFAWEAYAVKLQSCALTKFFIDVAAMLQGVVEAVDIGEVSK